MKKVFLFVMALSIGTAIALTVKANITPGVFCCDQFGRVCAVVNGQTLLGPTFAGVPRCPVNN